MRPRKRDEERSDVVNIDSRVETKQEYGRDALRCIDQRQLLETDGTGWSYAIFELSERATHPDEA